MRPLGETGTPTNAAQARTSAAETSRSGATRDASGVGRISLVTPTLTHWLSVGLNTHSGQMGMLYLDILSVPEPGAVLLLAVGGGVLGLLYWVGRRL